MHTCKAFCPACKIEVELPMERFTRSTYLPSFRIARLADRRAYYYHRRPDGFWCWSNAVVKREASDE